jgi:hypothetical protein
MLRNVSPDEAGIERDIRADPAKASRFRVAWTFAFALAVVLAPASAWADVLPLCEGFDGCLSCSSRGPSCPAGTTCASVRCGSGTSILKCIHCPTVIARASTQCGGREQLGQPCGDGGTCSRIVPECASLPGYGSYASCLAAVAPSEPECAPQDSAHPAAPGGWAASPVRVGGGIVAGVLGMLGLAALVADRRRRAR